MLKTAIYGMVRVTFDLIAHIPGGGGPFVLILGLISAVMGVLYALMQHDLKRLLRLSFSGKYRHYPHRPRTIHDFHFI